MNQIIEHTKNIFWIIHECTRVLKINGSLIIGVPNLAAFHSRLLLLTGNQPFCIKVNSAHVRGFTKKDLVNFIEIFKNGFDLNDFKGSNFYPFSPYVAKLLSALFPTFCVSIFFKFEKQKKYANEYLKYPIEQKLATNYYTR